MTFNVNLGDKVAVVTGGAGVIGSQISYTLSNSGAKVVVLGRTEWKVIKLAEKINCSGGTAIGLSTDVLNKESVEAAAKQIMDKWGRVDILINCAGGNVPKATTSKQLSFFAIPRDALKYVLDLNLMGTLLPCQVFGRIMAQQKSGSIINISSMAAITPLTRTVAYSAAKAGISNFTRWLAVHFCQEYSPNIRVNAIAPGFLLTEQNRYLLVNDDGNPTERGNRILQKTPMGRYGDPRELVGAILYLCSAEASFVTGAIIPIDGGFSAYSGV